VKLSATLLNIPFGKRRPVKDEQQVDGQFQITQTLANPSWYLVHKQIFVSEAPIIVGCAL